VITPDGRCRASTIRPTNFDVVQSNAQGDTVLPVDDRVMPFLKTEDPAMEVFPMVNNSDGANWVGDIVGFLNNPDARTLSASRPRNFSRPATIAA
jgi:hypothetical protein